VATLTEKQKKVLAKYPSHEEIEKIYFKKHPEFIEVCKEEILSDIKNRPDMSDGEYLEKIKALIRLEGYLKVAKATKLSREHLYRSFTKTGNPTFATLRKVMNYLGLNLIPIKKSKIVYAK